MVKLFKALALVFIFAISMFGFLRFSFSATAISYGETVTGEIAAVGEKDEWTFSGTSGDVVTIRFASESSFFFSPDVELFGPSGNLIGSSLSGSLNATLSAAGTFKITIKDFMDNKTGSYSLSLQSTNHPLGATNLNFGQTASSTIDYLAKIITYKFSANSNDTVIIRAAATSDNPGLFQPYLELYDPSGRRIAYTGNNLITQKVSSTGDFCLLITAKMLLGRGAFELTLQRANNPANVKNLSYNTVAEDSLNEITGINVYNFNANINDVIVVCTDVEAETSGNFSPNLEIYDSIGTRIASSTSGSLKYTSASSGSFYLFIANNIYMKGTGIYKLILLNGNISCYEIDLKNPEVSIIKPQAGEIVEAGSTYTISWDSSDNVGVTSQEIRLSTDSGVTYPMVIASGLAGNIQSYRWPVSADFFTTQARLKIIAKDARNNVGEAAHDNDFSILKALPADSVELNYTYDELNRLIKTVKLPSNTLAEYTYDSLGNRLNFKAETETLPAAPSNLTSTAVSPSQINLTWIDKSDNETGFKIERSIYSTSGFKQIATVSADIRTYSNIGLNPKKKYYYRVRAYNAKGNSNYSNKASATTLSPIPAAPSKLTAAAISSSQVNLSWIDNSSIEEGFKIERSKSPKSGFKQIAKVSANVAVYSDNQLKANTAYYYRVRAYNAKGNSVYSNRVLIKTLR